MNDEDTSRDRVERRSFLRLGSAGLIGSSLTLDTGRSEAAEPERDPRAAKGSDDRSEVSLSFRDRPDLRA